MEIGFNSLVAEALSKLLVLMAVYAVGVALLLSVLPRQTAAYRWVVHNLLSSALSVAAMLAALVMLMFIVLLVWLLWTQQWLLFAFYYLPAMAAFIMGWSILCQTEDH